MRRGLTARKFVTSESRRFWKARYESLNGADEKIISPKNKMFSIDVRTVSGSLGVEVCRIDGTILFSELITVDRNVMLPSESKLLIRMTAYKHCGSFDFK